MFFIGKFFSVAHWEFDAYQKSFPDVQAERELLMMEAWLEANPSRRKKNYKRFITNWLKAEQRKASERNREARVGQGPTGVSVRPEIFERIRKRDEARRAGK